MSYQLFIQSERFEEQYLALTGEEVHYLKHVLRLQKGAPLTVVDDSGQKFACSVESLDNKDARLLIVSNLDEFFESPLDLRIIQAVSRTQKMELIIQRCTELGVTAFYPVITARSFRPGDEKIAAKWQKRWSLTAMEAARQCRRNIVPTIHSIRALEKVLKGLPAPYCGFFLYEKEKDRDLSIHVMKPSPRKTVYLLIGPEGGFTPEELNSVEEREFASVSLGPRILRLETAAITATSIVQFCWGDLKIPR